MHTATIEKLDADAVKAHVDERVRMARENPGLDEDATKAKVAYERDRFKGGGYAASCECGWEANNPLPSEEAVKEALAEHHAHVRRELGAAGQIGGLTNG